MSKGDLNFTEANEGNEEMHLGAWLEPVNDGTYRCEPFVFFVSFC